MPVSIAAIKIAQRQANMPDAEYRTLLNSIAGVSSSKLLTPEQRIKVYAKIKQRTPMKQSTPLIQKLFACFFALHPRQPIQHPVAWLLGLIAKANSLPSPPASLDDVSQTQLIRAIEALKHRNI